MEHMVIPFPRKSAVSRNYLSCVFAFLMIFLTFSVGHSQADLGNYFAVQYYKVHPSLENEFVSLQTDVWKKIHRARIQNGLLNGWWFTRVVAPSGTNTEYDYVIVLEYDSAEKLTSHFEGFGVNYSTILDVEEIALALQSPEIGEMVYEEVWRTTDQAFVQSDNNNVYRYQVFNSMKMKPGIDEQEYQRIEHEYWKPVHQERIKRNQMYGWGLYTMIIPGGTERNYHWATMDFYHSFIDYLRPTGDIMIGIHGNEKAAQISAETDSKRDLLKAEIRELLAYMTEDFLD